MRYVTLTRKENSESFANGFVLKSPLNKNSHEFLFHSVLQTHFEYLYCPLPMKLSIYIKRVLYRKLLGVTFQDTPTNWDKHFDDLMERALKRMHILRVCRSNGYSVFDLHYLFNSLIMSLFTYCIRVWGVAACTKYLSQIDWLQKRAFRFGYIQHVTSIQQVVKERDLKLWSSIVDNPSHPLQDLLPPRRSRALRSRSHPYHIPSVKTERFKKCFVN